MKVKTLEELDHDYDRNRFILYSGHDSTIMPMLSTFGPNMIKNGIKELWAPYASMFIIEIHAILDNDNMNTNTSTTKIINRMFRLIYNGQVLTSYIQGCNNNQEEEDDLCDLDILVKFVQEFATKNPDCEADDNS